MFQDGVDSVMRDRVEGFGDVKKEHGVLFIPIQSLIKQLVKEVQVLLNVPARPEAALIPVNKAVERVLDGFLNDAGNNAVGSITNGERPGVRDPTCVFFGKKVEDGIVETGRGRNALHEELDDTVEDRGRDCNKDLVSAKRDVIRARGRSTAFQNGFFNQVDGNLFWGGANGFTGVVSLPESLKPLDFQFFVSEMFFPIFFSDFSHLSRVLRDVPVLVPEGRNPFPLFRESF